MLVTIATKLSDNVDITHLTELLLITASRVQHLNQLIQPALDDNSIVMCDRFFGATLAYQGYGHKNTVASLEDIINYATGGLIPDLTILLDLAPEVGLQRRLDAGGFNRLDSYDIDFHHRVWPLSWKCKRRR